MNIPAVCVFSPEMNSIYLYDNLLMTIIWSFSYWRDYFKTKKLPVVKTNYLNDPNTTSKINFLITDPFDVMDKYSINDDNIINLAGGFPVPHFQRGYFTAYSVNKDVFKTEMLYEFGIDSLGNPILGLVERTIDFRKRIIENNRVLLQLKETGFGTNLFINQINEARRLSFITLRMHAAGGTDYPPNSPWEGYKVWAKYGYIMKPYFQTQFTAWRKQWRLKVKTLNSLYWKGKLQYRHWERFGFSWDGIFDLTEESDSMIYLKRYLVSKHINVVLNRFGSL